MEAKKVGGEGGGGLFRVGFLGQLYYVVHETVLLRRLCRHEVIAVQVLKKKTKKTKTGDMGTAGFTFKGPEKTSKASKTGNGGRDERP